MDINMIRGNYGLDIYQGAMGDLSVSPSVHENSFEDSKNMIFSHENMNIIESMNLVDNIEEPLRGDELSRLVCAAFNFEAPPMPQFV